MQLNEMWAKLHKSIGSTMIVAIMRPNKTDLGFNKFLHAARWWYGSIKQFNAVSRSSWSTLRRNWAFLILVVFIYFRQFQFDCMQSALTRSIRLMAYFCSFFVADNDDRGVCVVNMFVLFRWTWFKCYSCIMWIFAQLVIQYHHPTPWTWHR